MSFPYSPYGLPYPPMPTDQYGAPSGGAVDATGYATQYPPMPGSYAPQAMPPVAAAPRLIGPAVVRPPGGGVSPPVFLGPPTAAPPSGTGVVPRPRLGPPIAAYGPPGGSGQPAGYGPGGPADPSVFVHPGQGNRDQFGSGLAATSPGPSVSDGGGDAGAQGRLGGRLLPAAPPAPAPREIGPPVQRPPGGVAPNPAIGPPTAKPPASVPNGATPVVGG